MPKFLEEKLKAEYPNDPAAPYKIMNSLGYMRGSRETAAGAAAEAKHEKDVAARSARPSLAKSNVGQRPKHWSGR